MKSQYNSDTVFSQQIEIFQSHKEFAELKFPSETSISRRLRSSNEIIQKYDAFAILESPLRSCSSHQSFINKLDNVKGFTETLKTKCSMMKSVLFGKKMYK